MTDADGVACGFTADQLEVVEDYIVAWNAQDVDAIMALFSPTHDWPAEDWPSGLDEVRCVHEAVLQSEFGVSVEFDACQGWFTDAAGQKVPGKSYPYLDDDYELLVCSGWCEFNFLFADDGLLHHTGIPAGVEVFLGNEDSDVADDLVRCFPEAQYPRLATDDDGTGSLTVSYEVDPGEHVLNVNVVAESGGGEGRADPRPREIGPDAFAEVTVPGSTVEQTLYGDGDIDCPDHWADDLSLPIGSVRYRPASDAIEIAVTLDQAWPNTKYMVDVNTEDFCDR